MLAGDKFMPELHLKQPGFILYADDFLNMVKEFKNSEKKVI